MFRYLSILFPKVGTKFLIIILLCSLIISITPIDPNAVASEVKPPIRILEITDSDTPELHNLLKNYTNPAYIVDSVRMKTFVALRDEIDGKYDAIYIGKGDYNAERPITNDRNHDTASKQNDITLLKMGEIQKYYIDNGLPVIVYSQRNSNNNNGDGALYQNTAGNLRAALLNYASRSGSTIRVDNNKVPISTEPNVIFVGMRDVDSGRDFLEQTNLPVTGSVRPRLNLISMPTDYKDDQNMKYKSGDVLTYKFDIGNIPNPNQRRLVANLYIGIDNVLKFGADQLIVTKPITSLLNNTITFRLPKGYSGVHYWKLEIVDQTSKLKDMQTGVLRFQDQKTKINVLQVFQDNGNESSSLLRENNMKQAYLKSEDYEITIKTMSMATFNSSGHKTLNGYYDMLIFGFADSYNSAANISQSAANSVKAYIATGQSVMFTHDTVFQGNQTWITNFQEVTGQVDPMTNMGLSAPQQSTTTKKVNEGLLTRFPFNISSITTKVNNTHNQYFGLKLEDPKLIPWYNITGGTRDNDDSWNHYYTYSYGNVTYSGTGHTNANFPDWEQKLFVNTMYRAFIGSNHAPIITVSSPTDYSQTQSIIPSYSDILVNYKADDFDLIDRTLIHSITFKYRATETDSWTTEEKVVSQSKGTEEIINQSFPNPLPDGGELIVYITASDKSGAVDSKTIQTKVVKVNANVDISRSASGDIRDNKIEKNTPFTLNYTITPKPIPYQAGINVNDLVIRGFRFNEMLPAYLNVNLDSASTKLINKQRAGTLVGGYTISGNLPDISYRRNGNTFIADPMTFSVTVTPTKDGNYLFANANLSFKDFYVDNNLSVKPVDREMQFAPFAVEAITRIKSLSIANQLILKGEQSKFLPVIMPEDATNKNLIWSSNRPDIVSIDENSGVFTGNSVGTATITARTKDGSNLTRTAVVTVIEPGLTITAPDRVYVGEQAELSATLVTVNENITNVIWSLGSLDSSNARISSDANSMSSTLTALNSGTATVTVVVTTDKGNVYTDSKPITIAPVALSLPAEIQVGRDQTRDLSVELNVTPPEISDSVLDALTWTSNQPSVASIQSGSGILTAQSPGESTITVNYQRVPDAAPVTATVKVVVVDLDLPAEITISKGTSIDLKEKLTTLPASLGNIESKLTWTEQGGNNVVSLRSTTIRANASGTENIIVTYRQTEGEPVIISKTIKVNVIDISLAGPVTYRLGSPVPLDLTTRLRVFPESFRSTVMSRLTWSDNASLNYLTVNPATGIVTGIKPGSEVVAVTYTPFDGGAPITAAIIVKIIDFANHDGDRY